MGWCGLTIHLLGSNKVAVDALWHSGFFSSCAVQWALSCGLEASKREGPGSGFDERIRFQG